MSWHPKPFTVADIECTRLAKVEKATSTTADLRHFQGSTPLVINAAGRVIRGSAFDATFAAPR
jgi:hypothetical protein